jgi:signal transduction histidine kinase
MNSNASASIRLLSDSILQNKEMDQDMIHEFVDDIGKESERLARTTEKLLALTKIDNNVVSERICVDMADAVKSTLRMLVPLAGSRMIELKSELAENCYVLANEDDIRQIVFNLVENAIKYNLAGGNVMISLRHDGLQIVLTVDDTGSASRPTICPTFSTGSTGSTRPDRGKRAAAGWGCPS